MHDIESLFPNNDYVLFEPKPKENLDIYSLEGCLSYSCRIEKLMDKNNLYVCEPCSVSHYGKSMKLLTLIIMNRL